MGGGELAAPDLLPPRVASLDAAQEKVATLGLFLTLGPEACTWPSLCGWRFRECGPRAQSKLCSQWSGKPSSPAHGQGRVTSLGLGVLISDTGMVASPGRAIPSWQGEPGWGCEGSCAGSRACGQSGVAGDRPATSAAGEEVRAAAFNA